MCSLQSTESAKNVRHPADADFAIYGSCTCRIYFCESKISLNGDLTKSFVSEEKPSSASGWSALEGSHEDYVLLLYHHFKDLAIFIL